jgi:hypothetical protein
MEFEPRILVSRRTVRIAERGTLCDCMLTAIHHHAERNVEHTDALCLELPLLMSISGAVIPLCDSSVCRHEICEMID